MTVPAGGFQTIMADPPWSERGGTGWGDVKRGADRHYPLLPTYRIPRVIRDSGLFVVAPSAHMYLWATSTFLPDALWVMLSLGFTYKTCLPWDKCVDDGEDPGAQEPGPMGLGQYFRGEHELLLFGTKGDGYAVRTEARNLGSMIRQRKSRVHSQKPVAAYERIEARSHGPYLELFARSGRKNWISWGNEIPTTGA